MENWRKYLEEAPAAFHGYKMNPTQMRVSPQCDTPPDDNQWEAGEEGCPQFTNDRGINYDHEDIIEAIDFLNNVKPEKLIAYSRGGAVALAVLSKSTHQPIIHGTADEAVPLWHSAELSLRTGMPLYVFDGAKHVNILKYKNNPESGVELNQEQKERLVNEATT